MWELFTLGKDPYPGMRDELYYKLKEGYRLEKPDYATQQIYDIMHQCWRYVKDNRPSFDNLEEMLGAQLSPALVKVI